MKHTLNRNPMLLWPTTICLISLAGMDEMALVGFDPFRFRLLAASITLKLRVRRNNDPKTYRSINEFSSALLGTDRPNRYNSLWSAITRN